MSELTKPTAGPWSWLSEESIVGQENEIVMEIRRDAYDQRSLHVAPQNRSLLIAAPDLLTAIEGVVRVADRKTVEFDAARAAIAKARESKPSSPMTKEVEDWIRTEQSAREIGLASVIITQAGDVPNIRLAEQVSRALTTAQADAEQLTEVLMTLTMPENREPLYTAAGVKNLLTMADRWMASFKLRHPITE